MWRISDMWRILDFLLYVVILLLFFVVLNPFLLMLILVDHFGDVVKGRLSTVKVQLDLLSKYCIILKFHCMYWISAR